MVNLFKPTPNPFWRSTQAALIGASATAIVTGGLLGLTRIDDQLVNRLAIYGSALGAVAGAIFGLVGVKPAPKQDETSSNAQADTQRQDWRNFVVTRKVQESREIVSFYLKPQDGGALPRFLPGQFLPIRLHIPGQPRPVIRPYSLSDYAEQPSTYRLSIKRERPPEGEAVPPGLVSNFMHDQIQVGSVIEVKPPAGTFVLDVSSSRPVVLVSNGVGITPMIAMAKAVSQHDPDRPLWFLHGARDGSYHAFREEVNKLVAQAAKFTVHYCYSRPRSEDNLNYHGTGYVNANLIQTLLSSAVAEADYFLCGSPAFMDALRSGLMALGVPIEQIRFESFAKAAPKLQSNELLSPANAIATTEVVFAKSDKTATWTPEEGTLLEFAEAQGIDPPFSCRSGICLTCMCRLKAGEVVYEAPPAGTPEADSVLICVSKPKTAQVVLDL